MQYCQCETPYGFDPEYDSGCRRCGLPIDFSPKERDSMIHANFTVESSAGYYMEFPYWDRETWKEQREKAIACYEEKAASPENGTVTLVRLSTVDLQEGDYAPTLLRNSADPSYVYEGFPEAWER